MTKIKVYFREEDNEMKIKNCPFCGGRGHVDMSHGSNKPYISKDKELKSTINLYHVFCGNCLAKSMDYEKIDDAIVAWNRRAENDNR